MRALSESLNGREATIRDVAVAAGLSKTTVSRVLNGSLKVSPETRTRVLEAIDRLDYQVNVAARTLRTARSSLVGLLVPAISNDVFGRIAEVLEEDLRQDGTGLVIMSSGWAAEGESLALESLRARRLDALVISLVDDQTEHLGVMLRSLGRPVVLLDREVDGIGADVVLIDQRSGIQAALKHLAELGHQSVGLATISAAVRPGREAISAYEDSAKSLGLSSVAETVIPYARIDARAGWEVAENIVGRGATAIICCVPNSVTAGVLGFLRAHGLLVPDDVSVIGFDESELASVKPPRLTVISRSLEDFGHHASRFVLTRLANPGLAPRQAIVCMRLHVQDSTAPPPVSISGVQT